MSALPIGLQIAIYVIALVALIFVVVRFLFGIRMIGNTEVGIVERTWGGGSLKDRIIALNGEAGFQPDVLRGGFHLLPGYMYKVHKVPLVTIHRGQVGYVFARDGQPLGRYTQNGEAVGDSGQTLAHVVANGSFTNVRSFLEQGGQQGPQRAILREGTYAINLAQFIVISGADETYYLPMGSRQEEGTISRIAKQIGSENGFSPVIIDGNNDRIGIVTVHDGPSLPQGDIIAPTVGDSREDPNYHNNFQDPQAFLRAGGYRGRQYQVLSEGTYWINRLFATVELVSKTHVEVGNVGVVISYYGERGADTSGEAFKHGQLCKKGGRGIWDEPLLPGKYAFNPYAGEVIFVPTINIILKWIRADDSAHRLDDKLKEIGLITKDAFEPELPLSVVISIDYMKAPHVIQRFGSVKTLVEQSLDPLVSSYFKNQGQQRTLIELIQERSAIQESATKDMRTRFAEYDLQLQEVLIGTPHSPAGDTQIETILAQLRERQVAHEQLETYRKQEEAQGALRSLNQAKAVANKQTDLTNSKVQIDIDVNQGEAAARKAMLEAERTVTLAKAQAESEAMTRIGEAIGIAETRKAYGSPQVMVIRDMIGKIADALKEGKQEIVPRTVVSFGAAGGEGGNDQNFLSNLMALVLSDKLHLTNLGGEAEEMAPQTKALYDKIMEQMSQSKEEPQAG